jgi:hypothetical protein
MVSAPVWALVTVFCDIYGITLRRRVVAFVCSVREPKRNGVAKAAREACYTSVLIPRLKRHLKRHLNRRLAFH